LRLTGSGVWIRSGYLMLSAVLVLGCADQTPPIDAVATDSITSLEFDNEIDESGQVQRNSDDPFLVFGVQEESAASATIASTYVWLVNQSERSLIVTAAGGAETVLADTLGAADSVLVRIETRADSVALSARTRAGVSMGSIALAMDSKPKRAAFPQ